MIKGLSTATFPSPFGVEGDIVPAFAVIKEAHARGFIGSRVITVTFDMFVSEAAYDAEKPKLCSHNYTITEIFEGTTVDSMDGFFDMIYQVVMGYDPAFANAEIVNEPEGEVE
jgi:hypothetical protein